MQDVVETEKENPVIIPEAEEREVQVMGNFFWRDSFAGEASNSIVIKSDFYLQIEKIEKETDQTVVGFIILNDGTIQILTGRQ